jgi:hypothetical protein
MWAASTSRMLMARKPSRTGSLSVESAAGGFKMNHTPSNRSDILLVAPSRQAGLLLWMQIALRSGKGSKRAATHAMASAIGFRWDADSILKDFNGSPTDKHLDASCGYC